jgi:hypothetical protein
MSHVDDIYQGVLLTVLSSPIWPMSTNSKCLLLAKVIMQADHRGIQGSALKTEVRQLKWDMEGANSGDVSVSLQWTIQ